MSSWFQGRNLIRFAGLALLPLVALQGAEQRSCWLNRAAAPSPSVVYAICTQGGLWVSHDATNSWQYTAASAPERVKSLSFFDSNRGLIVGDKGMVLVTSNAARSWGRVAVPNAEKPITENLTSLSIVGNEAWVAGYQGALLHTADAGKTWEAQVSGTKQALEAITFIDNNHGWAVGWAGTILRTENGGKKWEVIKADAISWSLTAMYFKDVNNGWLVGFGGQIFRTKDGGRTWASQKSPFTGSLSSITFDAKGDGWIVEDEGFLHSKDGGETWVAEPTETQQFMKQLIRSGNTTLAVGQSLMMKLGAKGWEKIPSLTPTGLDSTPSTVETEAETTDNKGI